MTKTAPCGYNDADLVRARKYIEKNEIGCHLWTGKGSGMKQRPRSIGRVGREERHRKMEFITPQFSLHCRMIMPKQLFYAAANGLAIDDVPQLTCDCDKRLCCNPEHLRPKLDPDGKPICRNITPRPITAPITPELVSKLGLTLTQAEINFKLASTDSYPEEAAMLRRLRPEEGDTPESLTAITEEAGMKFVFTQVNLDRYMKENPPDDEG